MALLFSPEGQKHMLIEELVREFHKPKEEIEPVFYEEYEKVDRQARIKTFVPLFASRLVKQRLGHA